MGSGPVIYTITAPNLGTAIASASSEIRKLPVHILTSQE